jgi:hypothetical protein
MSDLSQTQGMSALVVVLLVYFVPAIIATARKHHQAAAIVLMNFLAFVPAASPYIFAGIQLFVTLAIMFSVMWWCAALIWSATLPRPDLLSASQDSKSQEPERRIRPRLAA